MGARTSDPSSEVKLLPGAVAPEAVSASPPDERMTTPGAASRQLSELPKDELEHLADEFGLDPTRYKTRQLLVAALHDRRQMIAGMSREGLLDVVRWGRRPVTMNASKEQIAQEIVRIKSMRFEGLSHRGLVAIARLRGVEAVESDAVPEIVKRLKKLEGVFSRFNRKRRSWIAGMVANLIGEEEAASPYQFLPPAGGAPASAARDASMKEEIEEAGLFGGIANRVKKTADTYINHKLDEIESRIDRKLDEIDRRLAEWRDKEVANRIRILKITLWASVIVGIFSLIYAYVQVYFFPSPSSPPPAQHTAQPLHAH